MPSIRPMFVALISLLSRSVQSSDQPRQNAGSSSAIVTARAVTGTSSTSSSTYVSTTTASDPWYIPLLGYDGNDRKASPMLNYSLQHPDGSHPDRGQWGLDISSLKVSNTSPCTQCLPWSYFGDPNNLVFPDAAIFNETNSNQTLSAYGESKHPGWQFLGVKQSIQVEGGAPNTYLSTLPAGINLGRRDVYNGSLAFSTYYDANRINSSTWTAVTLSSNTYDSYPMQLAKVSLQACPLDTIGHACFNENVTDITTTFVSFRHGLQLPKGYSCNDSHALYFGDGPMQRVIFIAANRTSQEGQGCTSGDPNGDPKRDGELWLGSIFFQAAYVYFDGLYMYAAQAHELPLPPKLKPFNPNDTLYPAWEPVPTAPVPKALPNQPSSQPYDSFRVAAAPQTGHACTMTTKIPRILSLAALVLFIGYACK